MSPIEELAPSRLGGVAEVAEELGVSRQQVAKLRDRPDFPPPVASLSIGDVWDLDAIQRWSDSGVRRRRGRPSATSQTVVLGGRYALESAIGGGGFAIVYRARDLADGSDPGVAIKILQEYAALDAGLTARFEQELHVLSRLRDPHVVPVLAHGTDPTLGLWYAMPLARGTLADVLTTLPGRTDEIVEVMRQICAGLAHVHEQDVLHRDLKPENVLRTQDGTWALADFGLARAVAETSVGLTSTDVAMGSAFYTAPEQWRDAKRVDERADVYSVGKILQALTTGSTPVDDDVPAGPLRPVILKAIARDRRHRHESVTELLAAIEAVVATVPKGWETSQERAERLRPELATTRIADLGALQELRRWAESVDPDDYAEMGPLATTLSALSTDSIDWWWSQDQGSFLRVFQAYAQRLAGSFAFGDCDDLADFTARAIRATGDGLVLREGMRGLAALGQYHNRWHVRDVAVAVLQSIRTDEEAMAALEGLRAAGATAVEWTIGDTARKTLHPVLRAGVAAIVDRPQA